jgi:hypothetical protein
MNEPAEKRNERRINFHRDAILHRPVKIARRLWCRSRTVNRATEESHPVSARIYLSSNQSKTTVIRAQSPALRSRIATATPAVPREDSRLRRRRSWSLRSGDALSRRDRYPIKSDNRFTSVTQVVVRYIPVERSRPEGCRLTRLLLLAESAERGQEGRDELRQLQDNHHDPLETQPERRARLQRLRTLLQTPQREPTINDEERGHPDEEPKTVVEE